MLAIEAKDVCRAYGATEVLKRLSLSLEPGAFLALMGPSGCGKSTFLHLVAGLLSADAGTLSVGGEDITHMGDTAVTKFRRRRIGVVFQAFNLLDHLTVRENILLPIRLEYGPLGRFGRSRDAWRRAETRLTGLAQTLGLATLLDRKAEALSGGEQQRVALARALIAEPAVVLSDEPTGNLDAAAAKETCAILKTLNREQGVTILLVTHDPQVAATADRVAFLKDGRIAAIHSTEGDPARVSSLYLETYR